MKEPLILKEPLISEKIDMNNERLSPKPILVKHIKCNTLPKKVSASHQKFLEDTGMHFDSFPQLLGSKEYIIRHSIIEN